MVSVAGAMIGGAEFLVGLFILKYRPGLNIRSKPTFQDSPVMALSAHR